MSKLGLAIGVVTFVAGLVTTIVWFSKVRASKDPRDPSKKRDWILFIGAALGTLVSLAVIVIEGIKNAKESRARKAATQFATVGLGLTRQGLGPY